MPKSPQWSPSLRFPHHDPIHPLSSPIRATCPAHFILLEFITRTILCEEYKPWHPLDRKMDWEICMVWAACRKRKRFSLTLTPLPPPGTFLTFSLWLRPNHAATLWISANMAGPHYPIHIHKSLLSTNYIDLWRWSRWQTYQWTKSLRACGDYLEIC